MRLSLRATALACLGLVIGLATPWRADGAAKTDVVVLRNGDRVTCEIKQLKRAQLLVTTDDMGTVYIEWDQVARLTTPVVQEVHLASGLRLYGPLGASSQDGTILVTTAFGPEELDVADVVYLWPVRSSFWKRIDGSLNLGGSYTQSSNLLQLTPSFSAQYSARAFLLGLSSSWTLTRQEEEEPSDRADATLSYLRSFSGRWNSFAQVTAQRNTELSVALRADLGVGAGRLLVSSNRTNLFVGLGLAATRERPLEGESTSSLEGLLSLQWQVFSYDYPKTTVHLVFMFYPGLTEWGRVRGDLDLLLKREIWHDFTIGLQLYESFDSQPLDEGGPQNDWAATLSLGLTF